MSNNAHDLTALLGSRICHDLISPLGAIGNGLELLSMTGSGGAEMALIAESVANANARVRFYRVAYGAAAGDHSMGRSEIASILEDVTRGSRTRIAWNSPEPALRAEVKLAFLLIQCLETAMPYGGEIVVTRDGPAWSIHGRAEKLKILPQLWQGLQEEAAAAPGLPEITPAQVQFALAPQTMRALGRTPRLQIRETDILLGY
ncbi:histidine phosphotransferase family protein [Mangrovicoccus algicola]|uniref:Histidine phosphotransferase n=1 Tax=Mangrovicoccus algicola TaxID=2771008 RepID=A0A8J7CGI4_9RHOB|nr:histidine phosphotransferase family protein [Mangrovicoccus algicola]MBE3637155.1 histidine phosphotransferase [Mangrovicoccus algicola]